MDNANTAELTATTLESFLGFSKRTDYQNVNTGNRKIDEEAFFVWLYGNPTCAVNPDRMRNFRIVVRAEMAKMVAA